MPRSPIGIVGGKFYLARRIVPCFPRHVCYVEPFCGALHVLFRKPPGACEVINDIDGELINFWRCVRHHQPELARVLHWTFASREEFNLQRDTPALTDIQRAARYYYLSKSSFATNLKYWGTSAMRTPNGWHGNFEARLEAARERLQGVQIENDGYEKVIRRFDRPETFFYLDPPYHGFENCYGKGVFTEADFARLRDILAGIRGKFLLSLNDTPEMRGLFGQFRIRGLTAIYTRQNRNTQNPRKSRYARELLIANYDLPQVEENFASF